MSVSVLEMTAGIALLVGDLLVIISVFGSAMVLLTKIVSVALGRRSKMPGRFLMMSLTGLIFGTIGLVSLMITGGEGPVGISRLSMTNLGFLLLASLLLLALSMLVPRQRL
jgi:hypothetical protein